MSQEPKKDQLFSDPGMRVPFTFNERVADVFDDMIARSVPYYPEIVHMIAELLRARVKPNDRIIDLGCSTANTILAISALTERVPLQFLGVDASEPMLVKAAEKCKQLPSDHHVEFRKADLEQGFSAEPAACIIANLVVQFTDPECRARLLRDIADCLLPGGLFIFVEKIQVKEEPLQPLYKELYYDFKARQGYSQDEIKNKEAALEGVLRPFTEDANMDLLRTAGFQLVEPFFRWYNFSGFVGVKQ